MAIDNKNNVHADNKGFFSGLFYGWYLVPVFGTVMLLARTPLFHAMVVAYDMTWCMQVRREPKGARGVGAERT